MEDVIDMFLPQSWSFGVSLYHPLNRNNHTFGDWWVIKPRCPTLVESLVRADVEALFRRKVLSKIIDNIQAVNDKVFYHGYEVQLDF